MKSNLSVLFEDLCVFMFFLILFIAWLGMDNITTSSFLFMFH